MVTTKARGGEQVKMQVSLSLLGLVATSLESVDTVTFVKIALSVFGWWLEQGSVRCFHNLALL